MPISCSHPDRTRSPLDLGQLDKLYLPCYSGRIDIRDYRDRVWYHFQNAERASRYYSRLSHKLQTKHRIVTFVLSVAPVAAIALLQSDWQTKQVIAAVILWSVAIIELALIHFDLGGNVKAARIMNVEADRAANQWRKLWYNVDIEEPTAWVDYLEEQTRYMGGSEAIAYDRKLNEQCAREINHEFTQQFEPWQDGTDRVQ